MQVEHTQVEREVRDEPQVVVELAITATALFPLTSAATTPGATTSTSTAMASNGSRAGSSGSAMHPPKASAAPITAAEVLLLAETNPMVSRLTPAQPSSISPRR